MQHSINSSLMWLCISGLYILQTMLFNSVRNCCLSCSPEPVDLMEDQQIYNLDGPLDQQHFTVTKLQCKNSLHFSNIYHVFYKFILWRTTHFFGGPTVFLNNWSLDRVLILVKVEHWLHILYAKEFYAIKQYMQSSVLHISFVWLSYM